MAQRAKRYELPAPDSLLLTAYCFLPTVTRREGAAGHLPQGRFLFKVPGGERGPGVGLTSYQAGAGLEAYPSVAFLAVNGSRPVAGFAKGPFSEGIF